MNNRENISNSLVEDYLEKVVNSKYEFIVDNRILPVFTKKGTYVPLNIKPNDDLLDLDNLYSIIKEEFKRLDINSLDIDRTSHSINLVNLVLSEYKQLSGKGNVIKLEIISSSSHRKVHDVTENQNILDQLFIICKNIDFDTIVSLIVSKSFSSEQARLATLIIDDVFYRYPEFFSKHKVIPVIERCNKSYIIEASYLIGLDRLELLDIIEKALVRNNIGDIDIILVKEFIKFVEEHLNLETDVDKLYSLRCSSKFPGDTFGYTRLSYLALYSRVLDCFLRGDIILKIRECS